MLMTLMMAILPQAKAIAVADDLIAAGALTVVAAIWLASGAEFSSADDLWSACQYVYDNYIANVPELLSEVTDLARQWARTWGGPIGKVGVVVSDALWSAVCGTPAGEIQDGYLTGQFALSGSFPFYYDSGAGYSVYGWNDWTRAHIPFFETAPATGVYRLTDYLSDRNSGIGNKIFNLTEVTVNGKKFTVGVNEKGYPCIFVDGSSYTDKTFKMDVNPIFAIMFSRGDLLFLLWEKGKSLQSDDNRTVVGYQILDKYVENETVTISLTGIDGIAVGGTITKPADTAVTLPNVTPGYDEEGKVVYPDIPLDPPKYRTDTADIPNADSIPADTVIDLTTGAAISDSTDVPDVPTEGDLTLPDVPAITMPPTIIEKFPFCIPFDVARLIGELIVDPIEPVITVPVRYGSVLNETMTLDLTRFSSLFQAIRWLTFFAFLIGLAAATSRFIKW